MVDYVDYNVTTEPPFSTGNFILAYALTFLHEKQNKMTGLS